MIRPRPIAILSLMLLSGCDCGSHPAPAAEQAQAEKDSALDTALVVKAQSEVALLAQALARLRNDTGSSSGACLSDVADLVSPSCPFACGHLPSCTQAGPGSPCWNGPYVPSVTNDPWGKPYAAEADAGSRAVTVRSNGPDGVADTADDITSTA